MEQRKQCPARRFAHSNSSMMTNPISPIVLIIINYSTQAQVRLEVKLHELQSEVEMSRCKISSENQKHANKKMTIQKKLEEKRQRRTRCASLEPTYYTSISTSIK